LSYRFGLSGLALAEKTITNAVNKVRQPLLFIRREQKLTAPKRAVALDDYITRWLRWVNAGIVEKPIKIVSDIGNMLNPLNPTITK
jgi:hypothetical protein